MTEPRIHILFVCLGNICRSPTAEAVFEREVAAVGLSDQIVLDSAGTGAWHVGQRADARSRETATRHGIDIRSLARQVQPDDYQRFDYLIAMDHANRDALLSGARGTQQRKKVVLFRSFDPEAPTDAEVPDPYFGGDDGFEHVFEICVRAAKGLLEHVCDHHGLKTSPPR